MTDPDHKCTKCGYDLTGLDVKGVCPECGLPIEESLLLRAKRKDDISLVLGIGGAVLALQVLLAVMLIAYRTLETSLFPGVAASVALVASWACFFPAVMFSGDAKTRMGRHTLRLIAIVAVVAPLVVLFVLWYV